jgi:phosphate-selective porin OprO/OprP
VTTGQRTYFTYTANTFANGPQWRINPQVMYYNGPFSVLGEYVMNDQEIAKGAVVDHIRNDAWEGIATYVLTGEDASFDGVKPAHNFNPKAGDWGAFELVGRVSKLNVDNKAFSDGFASATASSHQALETAFGGTWYFSPSVKLNLDYAQTSFDGGSATSLNHAPERAILTRTQFKF